MLDKPHGQSKSMLDTPVAQRMPREIAPGVFWIGDCLAQRHKGKVYHGYNAAFLIAGETASCLVETGHPKDFPITLASGQSTMSASKKSRCQTRGPYLLS